MDDYVDLRRLHVQPLVDSSVANGSVIVHNPYAISCSNTSCIPLHNDSFLQQSPPQAASLRSQPLPQSTITATTSKRRKHSSIAAPCNFPTEEEHMVSHEYVVDEGMAPEYPCVDIDDTSQGLFGAQLGDYCRSDIYMEPARLTAPPIYTTDRAYATVPSFLLCPLTGCVYNHTSASFRGWKTQQSQLRHLSDVHLPAGQVPGSDFLRNSGLWICLHCLWFVPLNRACHRCKFLPPDTSGDIPSAVRLPHAEQPCNYYDLAEWPTYDEILAAPIPTLTHVPSALRNEWALIFGSTLTEFTDNFSDFSFRKLLLLPKLS